MNRRHFLTAGASAPVAAAVLSLGCSQAIDVPDADECPEAFKGVVYKAPWNKGIVAGLQRLETNGCMSLRKKRAIRRVRDIPQAWDSLIIRIAMDFYQDTGSDPNTAPEGTLIDWILAHPEVIIALVEMILHLLSQYDADGELVIVWSKP